MKKCCLLAIIIAVVSSASYAATLQRTILSHNGKITQYDANHWQDAINDAVAGDTVYFTPGLFSGDITITKAITLIGAGVADKDAFYKDTYWDIRTDYGIYDGCGTSGESTTVRGNITIAIPGSVVLKSTIVESINFYTLNGLDGRVKDGSIYVSEPVYGLSVKRCQFGSEFRASAQVTNLTLEDCYFGSMHCENLINPDIHNCYFENISSDGVENIELLNCAATISMSNCTLINCIIWGYPWEDANTYLNCVYEQGNSSSTYSNCWNAEVPYSLTKAQLLSAGHIGNDDTVVGPLGGSAPFTMIPCQPYVTSSTLNYVKSTKKLNVNVTVKQGK